MRGTLASLAAFLRGVGIIPAYAGNTSAATIGSSAPGDHPRVCGEHKAGASDITATLGSSPRMRGTLRGRYHSLIG